jgi:hypothetical protein
MNTMDLHQAARLTLGDVVSDSYGNPAVVLAWQPGPGRLTILMVTGSDCGRIESVAYQRTATETTQARVAWALGRGRYVWRSDLAARARIAQAAGLRPAGSTR